jgi:outer membrane biosynthesis protein TonB
MMTWMQEREQKWDSRHEDDKLYVVVITNTIAKVMKRVAPGKEVRVKDTKMTARKDDGGLETTQHADTTQEVGPEKRPQPQQQPKPKLQLKLQIKPQPAPKRKSADKPARQWKTVPLRDNSQRAPIGPGSGPALTAESSMAERPLMLRRNMSVPLSNKIDQEIASAIN